MTPSRIELPRLFNAASELVDRHITEGRGERIALRCKNRTIRYREIAELVNRVGNELLQLGVEREHRVALLLLDSPEFVAAFFGAVKIGAVAVPLNTLMRSADYQFLLNDSRAKVLIAHRALWDEVARVRDNLKFLRHVILVDGTAPGCLDFAESLARCPSSLEPAPTKCEDAAFWLYTSGSTGTPKAAIHLQHVMVCCADRYACGVLDIGPEDSTFSAAKLFFAYGLGNSMYFPFRVGASSFLHPARPTPQAVFEILERERPTLFFGVPTLYASMLATPDAEKNYDLSGVRLCVSAGEPLPAELYRRWKNRFGSEILDGIGTTEALHIFISNRPGQIRPGSSGTPVAGYEARIVDDEGRLVPTGSIGNLWIRGESICAGYWNQPEKTKQTINGEWMATGDKYHCDDEGFYWYCGRSDDMIKSGGIWVSPIEVEGMLIQHPAVLEAAVVGHKDPEGLEKPKAFVVLKDGYAAGPDLESELKQFVKDRIAPYKYPRWIQFIPNLPKTATGKIQRYKLRSQTAHHKDTKITKDSNSAQHDPANT